MRRASAVFTRLLICVFAGFAFAVMGLMLACSSSKPTAAESSAASNPKPTSQAAPVRQLDPTVKILGNVDSLIATPASKSGPGHLLAQGWAVSAVPGAPVTTVTLLVDGKPIAETETFELRPDVASAYGRTDFEKSGWKLEAPLKKFGPGKHSVTVRATNKNGDELTVTGVPLTSIDRILP
jgi:hypothetical protein